MTQALTPGTGANLQANSSVSKLPQETAMLAAAPRDYWPMLLIPALLLLSLPLIGSPSGWLSLSVAGLAMGMMIFIMASGLTLTFGLMDVLNFGHGAFIAVGAYSASIVLLRLEGWLQAEQFVLNALALLAALAFAMLVTALAGWLFERVLIMPVYGQHLKQILITMGGMIVVEQLVQAIWGAEQIAISMPASLRGAFFIGDAAIEKFRLVAVVLGLLVFALMYWTLQRTRLGLLIRAGVENREMVEALGYKVRRLYVLVFAAGSALAGLGGVLWGLYRETLHASMGGDIMVMVFIVIIIGGLGSVSGCFIAALLLALVNNYAGFLLPKFALIANIALMFVILLWRPMGLYATARR